MKTVTMHPFPASPIPLEVKNQPSWDERLWQHIIARAEQIPDKSDLAKAVFMACAQMWRECPQLTLNHFSYVLKKHSVRTDAEKGKILWALKIVMSRKGHGICPPLVVSGMPDAPAVPADSSSVNASPFSGPAATSQIPAQNAPESPAPVKAAPAQTTSSPPTAPPMRPARPSIFKAKPAYDNQRLMVRKTFEQVMHKQNLPDTTLAEKKHRVLSATITLWQHNPQLTFAQVERQLHYYLAFTMADAAAMGEILRLNAPESVPPEQVALCESAENNPAYPQTAAVEEDSDGATDGMQ